MRIPHCPYMQVAQIMYTTSCKYYLVITQHTAHKLRCVPSYVVPFVRTGDADIYSCWKWKGYN
jgi:hypothetical protein